MKRAQDRIVRMREILVDESSDFMTAILLVVEGRGR
jgi:hypothetical protein